MTQIKGIRDYIFVLVAGGNPYFNNITRIGTLSDNPLFLDQLFSVNNEFDKVFI